MKMRSAVILAIFSGGIASDLFANMRIDLRDAGKPWVVKSMEEPPKDPPPNKDPDPPTVPPPPPPHPFLSPLLPNTLGDH